MEAKQRHLLSDMVSDDGVASSIVNDSQMDDLSSDEETETEKEAIMLIQKQLGEISSLK